METQKVKKSKNNSYRQAEIKPIQDEKVEVSQQRNIKNR